MIEAISPEVNPVPPWIVNVAMILLTALVGLGSKYILSLRQAVKDREARLVRIEDNIKSMALVTTPLFTVMQEKLIKELTHFHTPEMDALLVKVGPPNVLTIEERERLATMLQERTKDLNGEISPNERDAATIFPIIMKRAAEEQSTLQVARRNKLKPMGLTEVVVVTDSTPKGDKP